MHRDTLVQTRDDSGNRAKLVFGIVSAKRVVRYGWVALLLLVVWPWETASAQDTNWLNCRDSGTCQLLAEHDADQETYPFLYNGNVVEPSFPRWNQYARAIREFPDVRSCLVESERDADQANVLFIDWDRVGTGRAAEVCIFRIGRSLSQIRDLRHWFEFHDFRVSGWNGPYSYGTTTRLGAYWSVEQWRSVDPSLIYSITGLTLSNGFGFVIGLDEDDEIFSVGISGSVL